jgi:hypothetical protein
MEDYQANSNVAKKKAEEETDPKKPKKEIVKVVKGEVVRAPAPWGSKLKSIFFGADFKRVSYYVGSEVLLPAIRRMIYDTGTAALGQAIFGEAPIQRKRDPQFPGDYKSRIQYNQQYGGPLARARMLEEEELDRARLRRGTTTSRRPGTFSMDDFAHPTRDDAATTLETMLECIDQYKEVTVAEYYEMIGIPSNYMDHKWGWTYLADAEIRQTRHGFVLDLPKAEPLTRDAY